VEQWKQHHHPIIRLKNFLVKNSWWTDQEEQEFLKKSRGDVLVALSKAEGKKKPNINELFEDVYDQMTPNLQEQQKELRQHLSKYPQNYPLDQHEH